MDKKVLLIEDDPFLTEIYVTKFKQGDFDIHSVNNGEEAISYMSEESNVPDLVLLDIVMPKMDGFEFLRRVKSNKKLCTIPVVFLTNLGQKDEIAKGMELGAKDYIVKAHFTPSEVVEKVGKILNKLR